ncbi:hypothetical protein [Flavimarina sp. Hel_I_48]|uniref:hypothetical protein n=1 Tax=Flavimarina sp. Hel_I_48 TaxID=1392488 RepID=UPI0004DF7C9C|nr:hypothetical protein [Flavimarina sp. Hel_I_48]
MYPAIRSPFRLVIIFCTLLLVFSCQKKQELSENNDIYKVIGLIINILDIPTPPPPPIDASYQESADFRDSIIEQYSAISFKGENIVVAIEPEFKIGYKQISLENEYKKNYQVLLDSLLSTKIEAPINTSKIKSKNNISLIKAPENNELTQTETWGNFDFLVSISKVIFNKKNTRAVVIVSIGSGKISGESSIFLFEKINDEWKILARQVITLS